MVNAVIYQIRWKAEQGDLKEDLAKHGFFSKVDILLAVQVNYDWHDIFVTEVMQAKFEEEYKDRMRELLNENDLLVRIHGRVRIRSSEESG